MPDRDETGAGAAGALLWRLALRPGAPMPTKVARPRDIAAADIEAATLRLAELTSAAFAAHVAAPLLDAARAPIPAAVARASRLRNRFVRLNGVGWARLAATHGIEVVCLKGLAAAYTVYPEADLRGMSDADLLVRRSDRDALLDLLEAAGLGFAAPRSRSPWGFVSDASYLPMISADGAANVDVHVHPDAWPLHLGLSTEEVLAAAETVPTERGPIRGPCPTHALLIAAANAGRDLLGPAGVAKLLDAALLIRLRAPTIDWTELTRRATAARLLGPLAAFLALARRLGAELPELPAALAWRPGGIRAMEFEHLVADYTALFPSRPGPLARLRREWLVAAGPRVSACRNLRRATGLLARRQGLPGGRTALEPPPSAEPAGGGSGTDRWID